MTCKECAFWSEKTLFVDEDKEVRMCLDKEILTNETENCKDLYGSDTE